ncbi:brother of CDO [Syngnathoides biaculeatus]|uniref:brother of CDO n=1 Tax=Syngnathoides biaculeatus TaxID=300417 RepID=UPI002ADDDA34|nr:brother of CDO [Syngnathoides biaculeatus]XP_061661140.1 brother of CDO [Syngnathoides biaculeatus]XP_061661141.1 brother of CDO [Syngnathoides biaculeatus]XP_061661142.1 brother of CDO [Syngnathoides biaculeatus]
MSGKRDWTPRIRKRSAPVLCALGTILLCCLQSSASVADEVPEFTEEPGSVVQKLGGSVSLRCSARPASASISWRLNGRQIADGDLGVALGPGGLSIATLSNVTLGRYQCVASNRAGALASVPADVTAAKLRDFEPDDQQEIEVDEGNTAVIECHLPESQPKAQVRYSVKQEWLETSKGNYLIMPSGNLQIANATREDEGPYKCAAYNPVTQEVKTSSSADRLRIRRSTSEAARIIYPPASRSIMVTRGQRLVLECVASGIPTPQVTWAKDGQDLRVHNNTRFLLSNLLIDAAAEGDSGTYACRADNGIDAAAAATVLYDVQVFEPPQVAVELQQQEAAFGETVRFTCQTRGKPAPAVTWLHNAAPLAPSPRHRLTPRVMRIANVGPQDKGLYQCMAENGVGSAQASARLIIVSTGIPPRGKLPTMYRPLSPDKVLREQPPVRPGAAGATLPLDCATLPGQILPAEAPIILSQPRTGKADYYELTWRPRHERGAPVLEYMIKYRKVGDPSAEWTSSSISGSLHKLTLAKLQPDSLYEVEMTAKNCAGLGQPAMMTFRTGKGRKGLGGHNDLPKTPAVPSPSLSPPEAPDKPTVSTATETSAYVTWIPRGNRGFPIQSFRVQYKKVKKAGEDWVTTVENIPPSRLSVEITGLEKGTSYKFRVVAVNVIGSSPPSAPSKAYTVVGGRTHERPVDGPYITYNEAINETTIILKWTYTPVNNTPIYGFYIYYRPTDSDNDSDYKKDVVEGDRYWHSIGDLQPETAYDIKMQSFNEKGESNFGNVVILETKARPHHHHHHRPAPSEAPERGAGRSAGGPVTRPGDLPYLIVGVVLGPFVFIIVIPFCLWRAWAKQKQTSDLCFTAVAAPVSSSCQYTVVPLQGLALMGHCPVDGHMTVPHAVYPPNGDYLHNGKAHHHHHQHQHLPQGLRPEAAMTDDDPPCDSIGLSNGYHFSTGHPDDYEQPFRSADDSSLRLLATSCHLDAEDKEEDEEEEEDEELSQKLASFPPVVSLEDEGIFTTSSSSSTATTPRSQDAAAGEADDPPGEATYA